MREGVQRLKNIVGDRVAIRPWLQSFPLRITSGFDPEYIRCQIDAAQDAGATGWLLWSPGNRYDEAFAALEDMHVAKMAEKAAIQEEEQGGSVQGSDANWHFEKCLTPGFPGQLSHPVYGPTVREVEIPFR
ncbi:MAG: putative glycoside hydrolase [Desulfomonilia bacterium]